jgi:hypothetical protein
MALDWDNAGLSGTYDGVKVTVTVSSYNAVLALKAVDAVMDGNRVLDLELSRGPYESRDAIIEAVHSAVAAWKAKHFPELPKREE